MRVPVIVIVLGLTTVPRVGTAAGLAVYVDGAPQAGASEGLQKAPDFRQGVLTGWRVFGVLLPRETRQNVAVIEAVGADGTKLRVENPDRTYPGLEPVVVVDPSGGLRFRMMPAGGRPAGGKTGGGGDPARAARLGVKAVVEIHIAHGAPPTLPAASPEAFDVVVAGKTSRITMALLQATGAAEHPPGAPGEVWPLRVVLEQTNAGRARAIVVLGRDDKTNRLPAADFATTYVRLNRRGLFKLERLDATGKRLASFPDVKRIDVEVD